MSAKTQKILQVDIMKKLNKTTLAIAVAMGSIMSANAATVFITEGFESGLGAWSVGSRGTVSGNDSGLYNYGGGTSPVNSPDAATNYATTDDGAFRLENGFATVVSDTFDVSVGGAAESITISFDQTAGYRTQSTRRAKVEFSNDNGTNWFRIANFASSSSGSGSVTITEGGSYTHTGFLGTGNLNENLNGTGGTTLYAGEAFGSQSLVRIIFDNKNDNRSIFIDNIEVTTTAPFVAIPEPSTTALLGLGGLALILRRRK
ncbi:MAG: PEP-CTERM sorting domain-containing protein [Akkermansiaceae bacterium]